MDEKAHVLSDEQLKCLSSGPRQRVYGALRATKGASATDIGSAIGMSSESVHFHLKRLSEVGLISALGSRATGKRPGGTFEVVHEKVVIDSKSSSHEIALQTVDATIRECQRHFRTASEQAQLDPSVQGNLLILRGQYRLNGEAKEKLKQLLIEATRFAEENHCDEGQITGFLMLQYPVVSK